MAEGRAALSEVDEELASMQGTSDLENVTVLKRKARPSVSKVSPKETKLKSLARKRNADVELSPVKASSSAIDKGSKFAKSLFLVHCFIICGSI